MNTLPNSVNGRFKTFEETFKSPIVPTEGDAQVILQKIKEDHSMAFGWYGDDGYVEHVSNGYQAVRHHAKYA